MKIKIFRTPKKKTVLNKTTIKEIAEFLTVKIGLEQKYPQESQELNICIVNKDEITELNETFLRHAGETDVIAFEYDVDKQINIPCTVGEIYVCEDVAKEASENYGNSFVEELILYILHGMLHLMGYDDIKSDDKRIMKRAEHENMMILKRRFDKYITKIKMTNDEN